jgi:hypothetical protein
VSALTEYFFTPVPATRSAWSVVRWWESRRLTYNVVVGSTGVLSLGFAWLVALLPPHPADFGIPLIGIALYGVMANICYSFGPLVDIAVRRLLDRPYGDVGAAIFRYGFVFSVGLTLLPIPLAVFSWGVRVLQAILR